MAQPIPFFVHPSQSSPQRLAELQAASQQVLQRGWFVLGQEGEAFENAWADFHGPAFQAVGLANGLDALRLAWQVWGIGPGDEVVLAANAYWACALSLVQVGAKPVLVEPHPLTWNLSAESVRQAYTPRTKAVLAVHLYGSPCEMEPIAAFCAEKNLLLVEDVAQAHGARHDGRLLGTWGQAAAYSFYPTKNLGALGDGGALVTADPAKAAELRTWRNYGFGSTRFVAEEWGTNSRLDELQAAFLLAGLSHLEDDTAKRRHLAYRYTEALSSYPELRLRQDFPGAEPAPHLYVIATPQRDALQAHLQQAGIVTQIHYPLALPQQKPMRSLGYRPEDFPFACELAAQSLSLPLYPGLAEEQQDRVIAEIRQFFRS